MPTQQELTVALAWADSAAKTPEHYGDELGRALIALSSAYRAKVAELDEAQSTSVLIWRKRAEAAEESSNMEAANAQKYKQWLKDEASRRTAAEARIQDWRRLAEAAESEVERLKAELTHERLPRPCHSGGCKHIAAKEQGRG